MYKHYHIGSNIPGYLPEGDVACVEDWDTAQMLFRSRVGEYQDEWMDRHTEQHTSEADWNDCHAGGAERCDWYEVWVDAEADRTENATPHSKTVIYTTPEGPDIAIFARGCNEAECEVED